MPINVTKPFFDTNILLYLLSADNKKADISENLLATGGTISVQVLNEFVSVARRKLKLSFAEIHQILNSIYPLCSIQSISQTTHEFACHLAERYDFSIYDACIVASALEAECKILYTEDLQHNQRISHLKIKNPFL